MSQTLTSAMLAIIPTVVIGVFASYIAWRQWQTALYRVKMDLFDRRFAIFSALQQVIRINTVNGTIEVDDYAELIAGTRQARWLLGQAMRDYCDNFVLKADELRRVHGRLEELANQETSQTNERREQVVKHLNEVRDWIESQRAVLEEKFDPFLTLPR